MEESATSKIRIVLFYIAACGLTLSIAILYLTSTYSGDSWAWRGLPLDDTWIHLTYARSLSEHGWFYYNQGIAEAGMSSPLWVILLSIVYKVFTPLGVTPQWCAKGLNLTLALGVPIVTFHIVRALKIERKWAYLAALIVILEPNLSYGNVSGMEVSFTTLLMLLAIWFSILERYTLTGIVLGLFVIARGEGTVIAIIIGAVPLVQQYLKREEVTLVTSEELKLGIRLFLPSLILGSLWAIYNYSVNQKFLPNTYYVKHDFSLGYFNPENLLNVWKGYIQHLVFFDGIMVIVTVATIVVAGKFLFETKRFKPFVYLFAIPLVHTYLFSINIRVVATPEPWTYFTRRYIDLVLPLLSIILVLGMAYLWQKASTVQNRQVVLVVPVVIFIGIGILSFNAFNLHRYFIEMYSWDTENIEAVDVEMGHWIRENLPSDATIGVTDAGAVRFFSHPDQYIVDFLGLNCKTCIGRGAEDLISEFDPDYLIFFRHGIWEGLSYEELHSLTPGRVTILGGHELVALKKPD